MWLERSQVEGERWLRAAAEYGDCQAMERLGERLIDGAGLAPSTDEGALWLRRSIESGRLSSMYALGVRILDEICRPQVVDEGRLLLIQAAEKGDLAAASELGIRLLSGDGLVPDPSKGEFWLRNAASRGDMVATIILGRWLTSGRYLGPSMNEGNEWLARAGAVRTADVVKLGPQLYRRALIAPTARMRRRLTEEAASVFFEGYLRSDSTSSINLAYLIRRSEVSTDLYPSLDELLQGALRTRNPFALVNQALRLAAGVQCPADWSAADRMMCELPGSQGILEWWLDLCQVEDPEGHLVVGWLVRHGLTLDPDGLELRSRFGLIDRSLWSVPDWMS
jgi:Sel1 repeat